MNPLELQSVFVDLEFADGGYALVIYNSNPDSDDNTQRNINELTQDLNFESEGSMLNSIRLALAGKVYNEFACKYFTFSTVYKDLSGIAKATEIMM